MQSYVRFTLMFFCLIASTGSAVASAETLADVTRSREIVTEALKARAAKQLAAYLKLMQEASQLRPHMPGMMVRLAGAYSHKLEALDLLERVARMGLVFNLAGDVDFATLKDDPAFRAVVDTMSANLRPSVNSETAFELTEKDFLPEGLAYDEKTRSFFVSSVH